VRAFILAAGRGTRLAPPGAALPKVLVPVCGVPMLDRLRAFLARGGVEALALNTHHLAEAVRAHLAAARPGGLAPRVFHEPELLGTGGALVNAAAFWGAAPLLVWNGDILADVPPRALLAAHEAPAQAPHAPAPLATLVVQARPSDSHLLVDAAGRLCGLDSARRGRTRRLGTPAGPVRALAFNGISVLAPGLRALLPPGGAFDLVDALLDAVAQGALVRTYDAGAAFYGSTGTPQQLAALEAALAAHPQVLTAWTP
jgi:mannose-1-phosphate guanylyltransferase